MGAQARPETDRPPWYRRGFGRNSPGASPAASPDGSAGNSPGGSGGNSPNGSVDPSLDGSPGASLGRSPGGSPASYGVQVVGDSVFDVEIDGWVTQSPEHYAVALVEFLQGPEYRLLHGRYVSAKALEERHFPDFLEAAGWTPMPWRTVSIALGRLAKAGKVTKKRDKEYRLSRGGKWKRQSVAQFLIPRPNAKPARGA